ncbi:MAG TPA: VOC family protein [Gemmatimonadaceae bacterium]|jgi:catechol 2,3-dioxygenase-like lactoylglutathione lyase family enzyme
MSGTPINVHDFNIALTCSDLQASIHFYTAGLGFEIVRTVEREGTIQFVMLKAGSAMIGLGQDDFAKGKDRQKGIGLRVWLNTTQDIASLADRATAAGLVLDEGPKPLPWGPMAFALTDPDGFKLTVANAAAH